ncbi:MAG: hypothetical protein KIG88_06820 [Weeksellaceae bacterium]|nr:hypothetical protein [Weeksellaceae bacterium]
MKRLFALLFLLISFVVNAQKKTTSYFVLNAGYEYWNGNYGRLGTDLYLVQENDNIFTINANVNLGYMQDQFRAIPEVGFGYLFNFKNNPGDPYSSNINSAFYSARVDFSPWTITPKVGFAVLSLLEFNAGYAFEFREYEDFKNMNGFKAGLTIHLPTQLF